MRMMAILAVLCLAGMVLGEVKLETVDYAANDVRLKGAIAYNPNASGKQAGVLVFPEWWGANDYARARARMLAELGYVAMVADMYGDGKTTDDAKQAGQWAGGVYGEEKVLVGRAQAAYEALLQTGKVDANRVAAVGYCFGGGVALNYAYSGANLKAVIVFHSGTGSRIGEVKPVKAQVLICNGAADKMIAPDDLASFGKLMQQADNNTWQYILYGGAMHAFTNPAADRHRDLGTIGYNEAADLRSWKLATSLLSETLK